MNQFGILVSAVFKFTCELFVPADEIFRVALYLEFHFRLAPCSILALTNAQMRGSSARRLPGALWMDLLNP